MNDRLGLTSVAAKFGKQIELDEVFRKSKKEFSKLPDTIPGIINDKWDYL